MKKFLTSVIAIDNIHGKLGKWVGPIIEANNKEDAEKWCQENAPYLFVDREIISVNEPELKSNLFLSKN